MSGCETRPTLGMLGLRPMGANMVRRLIDKGHKCFVWDQDSQLRSVNSAKHTLKSPELRFLVEFIEKLPKQKNISMMVPAGGFPVS